MNAAGSVVEPAAVGQGAPASGDVGHVVGHENTGACVVPVPVPVAGGAAVAAGSRWSKN